MRAVKRIRGIDIVYDDLGSGDVILLIHGQPFNRSMWNPQKELLSSSYRLIIPDLRGYGESGLTEGTVLLDELALDIIHLLKFLDIKRAHFVGLSMGAQVAFEIYNLRPQLFKSLILLDTEARAEDEKGYKNRLDLSAKILKIGMEKFTEEKIKLFMCENTFLNKPEVAKEVELMMKTTNPLGSAAVQRGRAERLDYTPLLKEIDFPVLIVVGDQDHFTPLESAEYMHNNIKNSVLEVVRASGHISNLEQSTAVNQLLLDFYSSIH